MKERNCWAIFGISAALAACLIMALVFIAAAFQENYLDLSLSLNMPIHRARSAAAKGLVVNSPLPSAVVQSPLAVSGQAVGWYFEGSFPIELKDANGATLATGVAQAQSDWTSANFVPFAATLVFSTPATATGVLILKKDNPSGLSQYDAQVSVPVVF
jgi:hypothetical protein